MKQLLSILLISLFLTQNSFTLALAEDVNTDDLSNNIIITQTQIPLKSNLRKEYAAYNYDIQNSSKQDIQIVNAQILNGTNGSIAIQNATDGHPLGTTWAICGPVGLVSLGIGWLVGLVATPIVFIKSSSNTKKVRAEASPYSNMVTLGYLKKGESIIVQTLVPIGAKPQLKLTVQDKKTKDLIMINK